MKLPVISTIIVAIAVAAMVYLGIWQLDRADQKDQLLATYAENTNQPAMSYPELGPVSDEAMFRKSEINCLEVSHWQQKGGKAADGNSGFRYLAQCVTGAEGPGALVNLGIGKEPNMKINWTGGALTGMITQAPSQSSLLDRLFGNATEPGPMLVVDKPVANLKMPAPPSIEDIPNNHMAYAVQWFLFALIAVVIFGVALRQRNRKATKAKDLP